jgi:Tol biopolymer transport system component
VGSQVFAWGWSWSWSPSADVLAAITSQGGVVLMDAPTQQVRRLLPDGWGADTLVFDPAGQRLTVSRLLRPATPPECTSGQVGQTAGCWPAATQEISLAADGMPLDAQPLDGGAPITITSMLLHFDYLTWCGGRLVVASGGNRYSTTGKTILTASAPDWKTADLSNDPTRSWVSPACSPDGLWVAAAAGPNKMEELFGQEDRGIWLLAADGSQRRPLTSPPAGFTDEYPRWSRDGNWLLFVRSGPTRPDAVASGRLYLARIGPGNGQATVFGPIAGLDPADNYYGHYNWPYQLSWYPA